MEEDDLDLMLPAKKKKPKKVDFEEGELLEKDDGEDHAKSSLYMNEAIGQFCPSVFYYLVSFLYPLYSSCSSVVPLCGHVFKHMFQ